MAQGAEPLRTCAANGCGTGIGKDVVFCRRHWRMLTGQQQRDFYAGLRQGFLLPAVRDANRRIEERLTMMAAVNGGAQ